MAKKKKEQAKDKTVVFRIGITIGADIREYLITAEWYELSGDRDENAHFYIWDKELEAVKIASFHNWIAIENLKLTEAWGERFEKLAKCQPTQTDMFKEGDMQELTLEEFGKVMKDSLRSISS